MKELLETYRERQAKCTRPTFARLDEVTKWGWSGEALLKHLIAFDRNIIGETLNDEREGTVPQWTPVFMAHPETWALLTTGPKNVVGYWHFVALRDEPFRRAKAGELLDSEITIDAVEPIDKPGIYNLYVVLIGALPSCPQAGLMLIDTFLKKLQELAGRGVFFREFCANVFTNDGKRICEGLTMTPVAQNRDFGTVYLFKPFNPWPERLRHKRWQEVRQQYEYVAQVSAAQQGAPAGRLASA